MQGKLRNMTSLYIEDDSQEKMLLLYRVGSRIVNNKYIGSAGGHFECDELNDARKCILRELREEIGLSENDITEPKLRYITLRYKNEEIRQNYYFFAKLINKSKELKSNEGKLQWFNHNEILGLNMPHTAKYIVKHYIDEGINNDILYGGIAVKDGINFTEMKQF